MPLQNFIVFEGIDGAGTTTQLNIIRKRTESLKTKEFLFTQEPSSAPTGLFLRSMLKGEVKCTNETAAYLFAADRNEHVKGTLELTENRTLVKGIQKACSEGKVVISDRYFFSSLAYQSTDCPPEVPRMLNSMFPLPQILFYFDIKAEDALKRVDGRGEREIYEKLDFLTKTVERYEDTIREYSGEKGSGMKIVNINATDSRENIAEKIWAEIESTVLAAS